MKHLFLKIYFAFMIIDALALTILGIHFNINGKIDNLLVPSFFGFLTIALMYLYTLTIPKTNQL